MTLTNCTISGNIANKGDGGAIYSASQLLRLINCTVTGNTSGVISGNPSGIYLVSGTAYLRNTIVNEGGAGCGKQRPMLSLTSEGYNFDRGTSCGLNSAGDQYNVDPLLGPLSANGGSTLTHALLSGSPAIDATPVYRAPTTDQRGIRRPQFVCPVQPCLYAARSVLADIGAYEFIPDPNIITLPIKTLRPRSINIFTDKLVLLVEGENFLPGATVYWNGTPLPTEVRDSNYVEASVGPQMFPRCGEYSITVKNPGADPSNALPFYVDGCDDMPHGRK